MFETGAHYIQSALCAQPPVRGLTSAISFERIASIVNRKDLVGKIASDASLTRAQASRALEAFVAGIQAGLVRGDRVTISGFGTFGVSERKARRVRNPRSGSAIEVAAKRVPRFAPGSELKIAIDPSASNG